MEGATLVEIEARDLGSAGEAGAVAAVDLDRIRPDLAEVLERHDVGQDHRRGDAVAKRHATARRTARENVADLVDDGSFVEYAPLVIAGTTPAPLAGTNSSNARPPTDSSAASAP